MKVSPLSVINWHPHKFNFSREHPSAMAASPASDTLKRMLGKNHKLRCQHIIKEMYFSTGTIYIDKRNKNDRINV
jgi:hypothetical protein